MKTGGNYEWKRPPVDYNPTLGFIPRRAANHWDSMRVPDLTTRPGPINRGVAVPSDGRLVLRRAVRKSLEGLAEKSSEKNKSLENTQLHSAKNQLKMINRSLRREKTTSLKVPKVFQPRHSRSELRSYLHSLTDYLEAIRSDLKNTSPRHLKTQSKRKQFSSSYSKLGPPILPTLSAQPLPLNNNAKRKTLFQNEINEIESANQSLHDSFPNSTSEHWQNEYKARLTADRDTHRSSLEQLRQRQTLLLSSAYVNRYMHPPKEYRY